MSTREVGVPHTLYDWGKLETSKEPKKKKDVHPDLNNKKKSIGVLGRVV